MPSIWDSAGPTSVVLLKRLQVDEGFLDGLDLSFKSGLNVLIGARGSGKTSVIELIRFCLGSDAVTERAAKEVRQHALSVLGSGRVTLTVDVDGDELTISRAADSEARPPTWGRRVIVLGQGEIESVALEARGRVALIDAFITSASDEDFFGIESVLSSVSLEIRDLTIELDALNGQLAERATAAETLLLAEQQQLAMMEAVAATATERRDLARFQESLASSSTRMAVYGRSRDAVRVWSRELERQRLSAPSLEAWPDSAGTSDLLQPAREDLARARNAVLAAESTATRAAAAIDSLISVEADARDRLSASVRVIRQRLESLQQGAGSIAKQVTELRELVGQASALRAVIDERLKRRSHLGEMRRASFRELEVLRQRRSRERETIADELESTVGPRIQVKVGASEQLSAYSSTIAAGLRGSGLQYAALAEALADQIPPLELAELVEGDDAQGLSAAAGISLERAARAIGALQAAGVATLVTAPIDDTVTLSLEVSPGVWRSTELLSTGQRCTVVLPLLLSRRGHPVLVDQPEDNLDNAYVADTVVNTLRQRSADDQFIFATHNPNIPVLADADSVIALTADGRYGRVASAAPLLAPASVHAITTIMEGGRKAFEQRAELYRENR